MIVLYHGSDKIIERPIFGFGKRHNDYGLGFYCTENPELAKEWSCKGSNTGYVNKYGLDDSDLNILNLNSDDYSILHWITILLENRHFDTSSVVASTSKKYLIEHFHIDLSGYDVVKGYRADDSYFLYAQDFISGALPLSRLKDAMRLGNLGEQIVLKSEKAFDSIEFQGYEKTDYPDYSKKRENREDSAKRAYHRIRSAGMSLDEITVLDIVRGTVKEDDPRLF